MVRFTLTAVPLSLAFAAIADGATEPPARSPTSRPAAPAAADTRPSPPESQHFLEVSKQVRTAENELVNARADATARFDATPVGKALANDVARKLAAREAARNGEDASAKLAASLAYDEAKAAHGKGRFTARAKDPAVETARGRLLRLHQELEKARSDDVMAEQDRATAARERTAESKR